MRNLSRELRTGIILVALLVLAAPAWAASSANFTMPVNAVNNSGPSMSSANFKMDASLGEGLAAPNASSANFSNLPNFQPSAHLSTFAPTITSATSVTFTVNAAGTFTVTAIGNPAPTLSVSGALPTGVTFTPATGVLAGTPASGTAGVYPLTFTAANGIAPDASQPFTLTVSKTNQTITFNPQGAQTYVPSGIFTINPLATSTSSLAVTYSSLTTSVCTVSGINVNILAAGTCTLAADQAGNGIYNAAPQVTQGINIAKRNQIIIFGAISSKSFTASPLTVSATATSGLAVVFTSATTGVCTVSGTAVTFVTVGTCTINANQPGDGNTNPAPQVPQSFLITQGTQSIVFLPIGNVAIGAAPFGITVGATSGLGVTVASQTPAVCSVSGTTVTILAPGVCTLQATQGGNPNYAAAAPISQSFTVNGAPNPPVLGSCSPGEGSATCSFVPGASNGGTPPTGYTLSCQSGITAPVTASGSASPITATGLTNGRLYTCTVTATNTTGTSGLSNAAGVTPFSKLATGGSTDINGDGKAEVLLRAANGTSTASLNANNTLDITPITGPGPEWRILGTGDFRGNHRSDLLIQNIASGDVHVWLNFEGPPDGDIFLRNVKPGWVVEAIADLDGDGKSDIIWRYIGSPLNPPSNPDDVGVVFIWFMNGSTISEIKARGGAPASWNLVGVTDLDGDGLGDMVWQSPVSTVRGLFGLAGRNFVNRLLGTVPTGYTLLKVLDFDADGNGDLLFRNAAGKVKLWRMNGATLLAEVNLPDTDPTWVFYAAADLNGDHAGDIVWKKADGTLVLWLMNAATPATPTVVDPAGTAPTGYNVVE